MASTRPRSRPRAQKGENVVRSVCSLHTYLGSEHFVARKGWGAGRPRIAGDFIKLSACVVVDANIGVAFYVSKDVDPKNSAMACHVAFFVYPGFVLLDLSGPLEAFARAEEMAPGSYRLSVMSLDGG